jgi:hypothetical protein
MKKSNPIGIIPAVFLGVVLEIVIDTLKCLLRIERAQYQDWVPPYTFSTVRELGAQLMILLCLIGFAYFIASLIERLASRGQRVALIIAVLIAGFLVPEICGNR